MTNGLLCWRYWWILVALLFTAFFNDGVGIVAVIGWLCVVDLDRLR